MIPATIAATGYAIIEHYIATQEVPALPGNATDEQKRAHFDGVYMSFIEWLYRESTFKWIEENVLLEKETYQCLACARQWSKDQLYKDPQSTSVRLTCANLFCGGTAVKVKKE